MELGFQRFKYINALSDISSKFIEHLHESKYNESMKDDDLIIYELQLLPLIT